MVGVLAWTKSVARAEEKVTRAKQDPRRRGCTGETNVMENAPQQKQEGGGEASVRRREEGWCGEETRGGRYVWEGV